MKIAYSLSSITHSGGAERVLSTKANYLADILGYEVHIIVLDNSKPTFFSFSPKIHIHSLSIENMNYKPWMIFGSRSKKEYREKLFQKLVEIKPDITISLFGLDAEFLYKSKDGSDKILEFHFTKNYLKYLGAAIPNDKYRFLRKIWMQFLLCKESYYASKYDHIILLTEKDKCLWGNSDRFKVIPNPLSFSSPIAAKLDNKKIIAVGNYFPAKGFDLLVDAFAMIAKEYPEWTLSIFGKGQDEEFLSQKIVDYSLENQVFLEKPDTNIDQKLIDSSIFVFPSRYEGFGLALVEAMECGLPCVAFDCECGPGEIIDHAETGFLVPPQNVCLFAEALKKLMSDKELRKQMGYKAKLEVARFYPKNIMPLWVDLFNQLKMKK